MKRLFFAIACLSLLSSCRVAFTESFRQKAEKQGLNLTKIQYYNSKKIVLTRTLSSSEVSLASGKVKFENGVYSEKIIIRKNTRGRCDKLAPNEMSISFEEGNNKNLPFASNARGDLSDTYTLNPENCKTITKTSTSYNMGRNYQIQSQTVSKDINQCKVYYDGKNYKVDLPEMPELMIKKKEIRRNKTKTRTAKGVRVS
jgi:hypothetical protein